MLNLITRPNGKSNLKNIKKQEQEAEITNHSIEYETPEELAFFEELMSD